MIHTMCVPLRVHLTALRVADEKFATERDRRYAEVNVEREKALKIKETADLAALQLAREIQTYKDEQANRLREQINSERGLYATKDDLTGAIKEVTATIRPLADYVANDRGRGAGIAISWAVLVAVITIGLTVVALVAFR